MTLLIQLKEEVSQPQKLKEEIERSVRDVMKVRGNVRFVPKGTVPDGGEENRRSTHLGINF